MALGEGPPEEQDEWETAWAGVVLSFVCERVSAFPTSVGTLDSIVVRRRPHSYFSN